MATKIVMHSGKVTATRPAVIREIMDNDPESETFGHIIEVEEAPEQQVKMTLPPGTAFGNYVVGRAYEVDAETAKQLAAKGFTEASDAATRKAEKGDMTSEAENEALLESERQRAAHQKTGDFVTEDAEKSTKKGARE